MADDTQTQWLNADEQGSWRALMVGTTLLLDKLDDELRAAFDISLTEYEILVRLSESEDRTMRMAQLADALRHSRSRVTHTVQRLEKRGLLRREESPTDGRGVDARMTDAGYALLVAAAPVHVDGVRRHVVDLAAEDDFAALGRVMNAVADGLIGRHPEMEIRYGATRR